MAARSKRVCADPLKCAGIINWKVFVEFTGPAIRGERGPWHASQLPGALLVISMRINYPINPRLSDHPQLGPLSVHKMDSSCYAFYRSGRNWKLHWNYAIKTHLHCGKHLKTIRVLIEFANMQASYRTNVACLIIYAPRHAGKLFS